MKRHSHAPSKASTPAPISVPRPPTVSFTLSRQDPEVSIVDPALVSGNTSTASTLSGPSKPRRLLRDLFARLGGIFGLKAKETGDIAGNVTVIEDYGPLMEDSTDGDEKTAEGLVPNCQTHASPRADLHKLPMVHPHTFFQQSEPAAKQVSFADSDTIMGASDGVFRKTEPSAVEETATERRDKHRFACPINLFKYKKGKLPSGQDAKYKKKQRS